MIGDALLYFRNQRSWARPYLSAGFGIVHFSSDEGSLPALHGSPRLPPKNFSSNSPVLRVAVGIDFVLSTKWAIRYSFSEAIRKNPISEQLVPPGQRNLATFQNLFGFVRYF